MAGHEPLYFAGVVAAAGEWCADHLEEAQLLFAHCSVGLELIRGDKAVDGKVLVPPSEREAMGLADKQAVAA